MSLVAAREGGQLKAKQAGVVRPGASRLSLPGFGGLVGGEIGQLLTRPRLTPGWGLRDESHPLDSWRFASNLFHSHPDFLVFRKVTQFVSGKPKMLVNLQNRFQ